MIFPWRQKPVLVALFGHVIIKHRLQKLLVLGLLLGQDLKQADVFVPVGLALQLVVNTKTSKKSFLISLIRDTYFAGWVGDPHADHTGLPG